MTAEGTVGAPSCFLLHSFSGCFFDIWTYSVGLCLFKFVLQPLTFDPLPDKKWDYVRPIRCPKFDQLFFLWKNTPFVVAFDQPWFIK
jgi:hypothetical protein